MKPSQPSSGNEPRGGDDSKPTRSHGASSVQAADAGIDSTSDAGSHSKSDMRAADASAQTVAASPSVPKQPVAGFAWRSPHALIRFLAIVLVTLIGDLSLKTWAFENVAGRAIIVDPADPQSSIIPHEAIGLAPSLLSLKLTVNTGAVFGLGAGAQWFFVVVSVVAGGAILYFFARTRSTMWVTQACLALILAGAIGNLYDRIRYNAVRDMLWLFPELHLPFGLYWPGGVTDVFPWLFNIADAALVVGVSVLMVILWRQDVQQVKPSNEAEPPASGPASKRA